MTTPISYQSVRPTPVNGVTNPDVAAAGSASPVGPTPLMHAPEGDSVTALMLLILKQKNQERANGLEEERNADKAEAAADAQQVQAMRDKADDLRIEGVATGAFDIGVGTLTIASAASTAGGRLKEADATKLKTDAQADAEAVAPDKIATTLKADPRTEQALSLSREGIKAERAGSSLGAGGSFASAGKDVLAGGMKGEEADRDADAAAAEASAKRASREHDRAHDWQKQMNDDVRFVIDWFQKLTDAQNQGSAAIAQRV